VRFIALEYLFMYQMLPVLIRHVEVTANDKVGRFLEHGVERSPKCKVGTGS